MSHGDRAPRARGQGRQPGVIAVAMAVVVAMPAAGLAQTGLSVHDVARLQSVSAAVLAPDGSAVAFLRSVPRDPFTGPDGAPWSELYVVDAAGVERPFVTGEVAVAGLAWTPDGRALSFLERRSGDERRALYVIPADGGEARRVLAHGSDVGGYAWSPDGRRVAFLAADPPTRQQQERQRRGFTQTVYEESVRAVRVWVADVPEEGEAGEARALPLSGSASTVRWSPAGDRLAVALAPTPLVDDSLVGRTLHVVDVRSGAVVARLDTPGKLGEVAWSPDGRHVAYVSAAHAHDPREGRVLVAPAEGGPSRDLLGEWDAGHVATLAWEDAGSLVVLVHEGVTSWIGRLGLDGELRPLVRATDVVAGDLSLSRDGRRAAIVADSPRHPSDVFVLPALDAAPARLTRSNPWLEERALAVQEVVRYRARDGLEIEGLLIRPLDAEAGRRVPLIVVAHGGPEAHYANGWLTSFAMPGQVAAARGFAVFHPNYRGSTGRGVAFSMLSQGDPAGAEFDDLVDGVDHLVSIGLVDRDRVGITGASYGGYASAWAATRFTDRFAASVMSVGVSNKISKVGTSDIPQELHLVHLRHWPWDDWMHFLERSPIFHVERARTPLLILHGADDTRVHPSQSLELYRHMKVRTTTPVRLVLYPGEGHGNRRAASRLDYHLRLLQWMEHYLMGPGGEPPPWELAYEDEAVR
jgi:dipeptidyl aminopeptidase/acylaminoacyl peptidase